MRAVDAVMECLKAEGVDVVFGLPGGANLPTYDAFVDAGIRHVLVRHEAGGGHAAEGYAKATGKVGVVARHERPRRDEPRHADLRRDDGLGARRCSSPARCAPTCSGTDGFQEADTIGITMPIVKHSFMIQHPLEIPRTIHEAFYVARTGRPGPGHRRHPGRSLARRRPVRAGERRPPARLPADDRRQREADPPGREGAGGRAPARDLRGRRRRRGERVARSWSSSRPPTASRSPAR